MSTALTNLFWWAPLLPYWQEVASIVAYFVVWYGLGYLAGWFTGRRFLYKHMSKMMRGMAKQMMSGLPPSEWQGFEHTDSMAIHVTPGVLHALHDMNATTFIKAIWPTELPAKLVEPTMHMMRSGHRDFSPDEKQWSDTWLRRRGFLPGESGGHAGNIASEDDDTGEGNPTIN